MSLILDAHTHTGSKTIIASSKDLLKSMDDAKIDTSLVFAGKLNDNATANLLKDIEKYYDSSSDIQRLYAIGSVSPLTPRDCAPQHCEHFSDFITYLDNCLMDHRIHGLKFYPGYEHFYPYDETVEQYLDLLVKHNKPAIFHSGDLFNGVEGAKLKYAHPLHIDELATNMPKLKIIIAHVGYPWVRDAAEVCYKNKNVYADCSGFVYGKFFDKDIANYKIVLDEFIRVADGTNKLIFGSDWPISEQKSYVDTIKILCDELNVSKEEYEQVMGERAAVLFGLRA